MDLWIWNEGDGALVKVESLRIRRKTGNEYEGDTYEIVAGNSAGEVIVARYYTEKEAMTAIKLIAIELDVIEARDSIKLFAIKKTGQIAHLIAAL